MSFATFSNFLKNLGQHVPGRIDKSVMSNLAGGVQLQVPQGLKYLKLINPDGTPTDKLAPLVTSGADHRKALRSVLTAAYPFMSDGKFKLETASPKMLDDEFAKLATGDTVRKCVTFFIPAATAAGITISPHIKLPKKRTTPNGKAQKPKLASTVIDGQAASAETCAFRKVFKISGRGEGICHVPALPIRIRLK